ncbi:MAG: biopolymer transporter ExbD [Bacteroidota bacterium]
MSLLETRNKKFNLPFVFIAGVIFLVGLAFFANYLENLPTEETDVAVETEKIIQLRVEENAEILLDGTKIDASQLESILKEQFDCHANPVIQLETSEIISSEKLVHIMEIARKNNYKVILEKVLK